MKQAVHLDCPPLFDPSLQCTQLGTVHPCGGFILDQPRQHDGGTELRLLLQPKLYARPHVCQGIFSGAPMAGRMGPDLMRWSDLGVLPRSPQCTQEGLRILSHLGRSGGFPIHHIGELPLGFTNVLEERNGVQAPMMILKLRRMLFAQDISRQQPLQRGLRVVVLLAHPGALSGFGNQLERGLKAVDEPAGLLIQASQSLGSQLSP